MQREEQRRKQIEEQRERQILQLIGPIEGDTGGYLSGYCCGRLSAGIAGLLRIIQVLLFDQEIGGLNFEEACAKMKVVPELKEEIRRFLYKAPEAAWPRELVEAYLWHQVSLDAIRQEAEEHLSRYLERSGMTEE